MFHYPKCQFSFFVLFCLGYPGLIVKYNVGLKTFMRHVIPRPVFYDINIALILLDLSIYSSLSYNIYTMRELHALVRVTLYLYSQPQRYKKASVR